jgi:hypothetical protein
MANIFGFPKSVASVMIRSSPETRVNSVPVALFIGCDHILGFGDNGDGASGADSHGADPTGNWVHASIPVLPSSFPAGTGTPAIRDVRFTCAP